MARSTSPGPGSACDLTSVTTCSVKEAGCARAASFNPSTRCRPQRDGVRLQRGTAGSWIWVAPLFFCCRVPTHSVLSHDELPSTASSACTVPHLRETGERSPEFAGIELRKQRDAGRFRYVKK